MTEIPNFTNSSYAQPPEPHFTSLMVSRGVTRLKNVVAVGVRGGGQNFQKGLTGANFDSSP